MLEHEAASVTRNGCKSLPPRPPLTLLSDLSLHTSDPAIRVLQSPIGLERFLCCM